VALNSGGGIAASSTAELLVRNSVVSAPNDVNAIVLSNGSLELLYTTVAGAFDPSFAISCDASHTLTIRNSVLFNRHAGATLDGCTNAAITHSAGDDPLPGTDNTTFMVAPTLFENLS